jgi:hypothetical protein
VTITCVSFGNTGPTITYMMFADDNIVFLEANSDSLHAPIEFLAAYEACSVQRVNLHILFTFFGKRSLG